MESKYRYMVRMYILSPNYYDEEVTLREGEEQDFVLFLKEFDKYRKNPGIKDAAEKINRLFKTMINNSHYNNFSWEKTFEFVDLNVINKDELIVFDEMLRKTHYNNFIDKLDTCDDITLACYYYERYAEVNDLPKDKVMKVFNSYIDKYVKRANISYEQLFVKVLEKGFAMHGSISLNENAIYVAGYLLEHMTFKVMSEDVILNYITNCNQYYRRVLIRKFLSSSKQMSWGVSMNKLLADFYREHNILSPFIDRVSLYLYAKEPDKALETLNSDEYSLYDEDKLDKLYYGSIYQESTNFIDYLYNILQVLKFNNKNCGGFDKQNILDIINNDEIDVLNIECIKFIGELLTEEEFKMFMLDIIEEEIPVYCGKRLLFTHEYLDNKNARKISKEDLVEYSLMMELLEKDKYLSNTK